MADRSGIKVTASDALEFESVAPKARRGGGALKTVLFVIVAVFVGAGGWAFYGERLLTLFAGSSDEVPVIRADISPIKVRPENPGGLQVPDRDKLVYNRIQSGGGASNGAAVERLLPPPETPMEMPAEKATTPEPQSAIVQVPSPSIAKTPSVSDVASAVMPEPAPAAPTAPKSLNALSQQANKVPEIPKTGPTRLSKVAPAPATTPSVAPAPKAVPPKPVQKAVAQPATPPATPAVTPSNKVYRVQLAAARTPEAARKEWDRLRRGNLDILGDLGLSVTRIDLGGSKGVFYRLRAGPLDGDKEARALCKILAQRKIGCLVVRPGK